MSWSFLVSMECLKDVKGMLMVNSEAGKAPRVCAISHTRNREYHVKWCSTKIGWWHEDAEQDVKKWL